MPNVLVTGSSRGIGLAIAESFVKIGANVVLNCKSSCEELIKHQKRLNTEQQNVMAILADVSDYTQAKAMYEQILENIGSLDVLINNAGIASYGLFSDSGPDEWKKVIDTNFYSVLNCTSLAVNSMVKNKKGVIINISSIWGITGASCEAVYSATKGAVNSFTKAMAKELGPSGVRVNAVACGVIDTEMNAAFSQEEREDMANSIALRRFGLPAEVAGLAIYLASDEAKYINGQIITIDGGFY